MLSADWPKQIVALDVETVPEPATDGSESTVNRFRLAACKWIRIQEGDAQEWEDAVFTDPDELLRWLDAKAEVARNLWIFAHNASFDAAASGLLAAARDGRLSLESPEPPDPDKRKLTGLLVVDPPPFLLFGWLPSGGRILLVDLCNWYRCPLAEVGRMLDKPKLAMPDFADEDGPWVRYCLNDANIVLRAVQRLERMYREAGMKRFPFSAAGGAYGIWSKGHRPRKFKPSGCPVVKRAERACYYGGRAAMFYGRQVTGSVVHVDCNSLFPSVMHDGKFPVRLIRVLPKNPDGWKLTPGEALKCIGRVRIVTDEHSYPVRTDDGVIYATGDFDTWLAGPELAHAVQCGHAIRILEGYEYELADLFTSFTLEWWERRAACKRDRDPAGESLAKLTANGLYGKFARRKGGWKYVGTGEDNGCDEVVRTLNLSKADPERLYEFGVLRFQRTPEEEDPHAFPAVSAWVTSYARLRMDAARAAAGEKGVYCQAVDSLFLTPDGWERLQADGQAHESQPGKFRLLGVDDGVEYIGLNSYIGRLGRRVAGLRVNAKQTGPLQWEQESFETVMSALGGPRAAQVRSATRTFRVVPPERVQKMGRDGWLEPRRVTG